MAPVAQPHVAGKRQHFQARARRDPERDRQHKAHAHLRHVQKRYAERKLQTLHAHQHQPRAPLVRGAVKRQVRFDKVLPRRMAGVAREVDAEALVRDKGHERDAGQRSQHPLLY